MALHLHNPTSTAHLDDLRDRILTQLACTPRDVLGDRRDLDLTERLVGVVQAMDQGHITPREALEVFSRTRIPSFSFGRWIVEMVDEGIYLDEVFNEAA